MSDEFQYDDASHTYSYKGARVISVTQAINRAGLIDDTWFTEFSRQRGKAVHLATQFDDEGCLDEESVDPKILGYVQAKRRFAQETGFKADLIEARILNLEFGYAGTLDRACTDKRNRIIVDYKTGPIPFWCRIQTAAYGNGLPNGPTYTRFGVQLKENGTYKLERYDVKEYRQDLNDFMAILRTAQIRDEYCRN